MSDVFGALKKSLKDSGPGGSFEGLPIQNDCPKKHKFVPGLAKVKDRSSLRLVLGWPFQPKEGLQIWLAVP